MGKRLRSQRRGKGGPTFEAKHTGLKSEYCSLTEKQAKETLKGQVNDIIKPSGRSNLLAVIEFEDGNSTQFIAAEGIAVGQEIEAGKKAATAIGNVLPLASIPEGCPIFNIELVPGDGGKAVRGTGIYAVLVNKDKKAAYVKMPSGTTKEFKLESRATIGCSAGGGRKEKPRVKAGISHHFMRAKSRHYPTLRGVAMNALDHPFGGAQHHAGKSKSTSKNAPPGRKVGSIGSKRTGRKKKN